MRQLVQTTGCELLKARRSRLPLWTLLAFMLAPISGGFFMVVIRDPEMARRLGLISTKANVMAGSADWETYMGLLAQATAVGGVLLFSIVASWVFGREWADGTVKNLLALPTRRAEVVAAKFVLVIGWCVGLTAAIYVIGLAVGALVGLPRAPIELHWEYGVQIAVAGSLTAAAATPIGFFASAGRGYLPGIGAGIIALVLAQIVAAAGWGAYFPWSIPALQAGLAGPEFADVGWTSYGLVLLTFLAGIIATLVWWELADQSE